MACVCPRTSERSRPACEQALDAVYRGTGDRQRLVAVRQRDDHLAQAGATRHQRRRQAARDAAHGAIEGELSQDEEIGQAGRRQVAVRRQDAEGDRQVEPGSLLAQVGGRQADGDAARRDLEPGVADGGAHAVGALAHRRVGKPDGVDSGETPADVALDEEGDRFDAEENGASDPGEHERLRATRAVV